MRARLGVIVILGAAALALGACGGGDDGGAGPDVTGGGETGPDETGGETGAGGDLVDAQSDATGDPLVDVHEPDDAGPTVDDAGSAPDADAPAEDVPGLADADADAPVDDAPVVADADSEAAPDLPPPEDVDAVPVEDDDAEPGLPDGLEADATEDAGPADATGATGATDATDATGATDATAPSDAMDAESADIDDVDLGCCAEIVCGPGKYCSPDVCDCLLVCCSDEECAAEGLACDAASCQCVPGLGSECPAFLGDEDPCIGGTWCEPLAKDAASGAMMGECTPADGVQPQFSVCGGELGPCLPGLGCIDTSADYQACFTYCDPAVSHDGDPGLCQEQGQVCAVVPQSAADGSILGLPDYGFCQAGCTPWLNPALTGCQPTEWCAPFNFNAHAGACVQTTGEAHAGDPCGGPAPGPATTCGPGLICLGDATGGSCSVICDPDAPPGSPGATCAGADACAGLQINNPDGTTFPLDLGSCIAACDFHLGVSCSDELLSCSPGELFVLEFDVCLTPPEHLPEWPLPEFEICPPPSEPGQLCGPNSVCLEADFLGGPGLRCYDLCIASAGPIGAPDHPDCRRDTALCMEAFAEDLGFGLCGPDVAP